MKMALAEGDAVAAELVAAAYEEIEAEEDEHL
jgi:hypothetical protein